MALSGLALAAARVDAAPPSVNLTVKAAAETMYVGEPLRVFVVIENKSDVSLSAVAVELIADGFEVERRAGEPAKLSVPSQTSTVASFTVKSTPERRPGKYSLLADVEYHWREDKLQRAARAVKDLTVELKHEGASGVAAPTVSVTTRAVGDTLREDSKLDVNVFVENKSAIPLERITVAVFGPEGVERPEPKLYADTLLPFSTLTVPLTMAINTRAKEGLKYGKHTVMVSVGYTWRYGHAQYTSSASAPLEFSTSFLGAEGLTQVLGVPLTLIVFVLPGFCFMLTYAALGKRLLQKGESFTPTTKDGIFYSVMWSILVIFVYQAVFRKNLFAFFTFWDLVYVSLLGAGAGAVVPLIQWKRLLDREAREAKVEAERHAQEAKRLAQEEALRFTEIDQAVDVLRKAASRRPNLDAYDEITATEGDVQWRGIRLSRPGNQPVVLGAQVRIWVDANKEDELRASMPTSAETVDAFVAKLSALNATFEKGTPIRRTDAQGSTSDEPAWTRILASSATIKNEGTTPLWDIALR